MWQAFLVGSSAFTLRSIRSVLAMSVSAVLVMSLLVSSCASVSEDAPMDSESGADPASATKPLVDSSGPKMVEPAVTASPSDTVAESTDSKPTPVIGSADAAEDAAPEDATDDVKNTAPATASSNATTLETGTLGTGATRSDRKSGILPSTRRSAKGLPPEIAGYVVWFGVKRDPAATTTEKNEAHLVDYKTYIEFPSGSQPAASDKVGTLEAGTIAIREAKGSADDFVRHLDVMRLKDEGWEYQRFQRERATEGFAAAETTESCSKCHGIEAAGLPLATQTLTE